MDRSKAKMINYGIVYGLSDYGLADRLNIPREEAKAFIDAYLERFPRVAAFMRATIERGHRAGLRDDALRPPPPDPRAAGAQLPGAHARRAPRGQHGHPGHRGRRHEARDDRRARARCADAGLRDRMILTIHDELLFEGPPEEAEAVARAGRARDDRAVGRPRAAARRSTSAPGGPGWRRSSAPGTAAPSSRRPDRRGRARRRGGSAACARNAGRSRALWCCAPAAPHAPVRLPRRRARPSCGRPGRPALVAAGADPVRLDERRAGRGAGADDQRRRPGARGGRRGRRGSHRADTATQRVHQRRLPRPLRPVGQGRGLRTGQRRDRRVRPDAAAGRGPALRRRRRAGRLLVRPPDAEPRRPPEGRLRGLGPSTLHAHAPALAVNAAGDAAMVYAVCRDAGCARVVVYLAARRAGSWRSAPSGWPMPPGRCPASPLR